MFDTLKIPVFTFKPLRRKRFRCNQTGVIVKNCKAYRRSQTNKGKHFHQRIPLEARDLPQVELSKNGRWECPYSHPWYVFAGFINFAEKTRVAARCGCKKVVFIIKQGIFYL